MVKINIRSMFIQWLSCPIQLAVCHGVNAYWIASKLRVKDKLLSNDFTCYN